MPGAQSTAGAGPAGRPHTRGDGDPMRIVVVHPEAAARERWVAALSERLPQAGVSAWIDARPADPDAPDGASDGRQRAEPASPETRSVQPGADAEAGDGPSRADYAVGWNPPADFFERVRVTRAFFSTGAGVDHLLRHPGLPPALAVHRLEDVGMGSQMAEYCCHEVLRVFRRVDEYERQQRDGVWRELDPQVRERFEVGVVGLGVLGAQVARALRGFGFPVLGYSRTPRRVEGVECFAGADALAPFLARCRVLILLAPLTADTDGFANRERLAALPVGAWLVNVARGRLVVDEDLLDAIDSGRLAGATLDVFRTEPLPDGHPFWRHPKIRMTPHVSAVTIVEESATQVADGIRALERGESALGLVDRSRGY